MVSDMNDCKCIESVETKKLGCVRWEIGQRSPVCSMKVVTRAVPVDGSGSECFTCICKAPLGGGNTGNVARVVIQSLVILVHITYILILSQPPCFPTARLRYSQLCCMSPAVAPNSISRHLFPRTFISLRSGPAILTLATRTTQWSRQPFLSCVPQRTLQPRFTRGYAVQPPGGGFPGFIQQQQKGDALKEYVSGSISHFLTACVTLPQSVDLTEMARNGKLDPVIGRDDGECHTIWVTTHPTDLLQRYAGQYKVRTS